MAEFVARKLDFCRRLLLGVAGLMAVAATVAVGQTNAPQAENAAVKAPEFEVASITPDKSGAGGMRIMFTPDGCSATNLPLKFLISMAYGIRQDLISGGPGWIDSARYDIDAKVAGPGIAELNKFSFDQRKAMFQPLLADRFNLKLHSEIKNLPIYDLVIAKNGPKVHEAKPGDTYPNGIKGADGISRAGMMWMGDGQITGQGIPMANLTNELARQLHRTVIDKTELTGKYDVTLKWTPEEGLNPPALGPASGPQETGSTPPPDTSGPSIFTAIQEQLGLKLESDKGPVETIVIDHIETPSEN